MVADAKRNRGEKRKNAEEDRTKRKNMDRDGCSRADYSRVNIR